MILTKKAVSFNLPRGNVLSLKITLHYIFTPVDNVVMITKNMTLILKGNIGLGQIAGCFSCLQRIV